MRAGFATTTGDMHVRIYESRNHTAPSEVDDLHLERRSETRALAANPDDAIACNENVAEPLRVGREELGVEEKVKHAGI